jgi:transcriptional regulator of acetoin/glycerol metabolism
MQQTRQCNKMADDLIRVSEAARQIGLNRSTLTRQVKAGLIRSHNGLVRLSEVLEDRAANIEARISEAESHATNSVAQLINATNSVAQTPDATQSNLSGRSADQPVDHIDSRDLQQTIVDGQAMPLAKAKALKETYLARLHQLDFEQRSGRIVDKAAIENRIFDYARRSQNAWMNWPSQIAPMLASELGVDQVKLTVLLENYVRRHLTDMTDQFRAERTPSEERAARQSPTGG